jgi:hypothetical protein
MGAKSKIKKSKGKKQKKAGPKKQKQQRLAKLRGNAPDPKRRDSQLRG